MGRFFSCLLVSLMLLPAPGRMERTQPVFFSMLFPQLVPFCLDAAENDEAVML